MLGAGVVRAHVGLKEYLAELQKREVEHPEEGPLRHPFKLLLGSEFAFRRPAGGDRARPAGWGGLCQLSARRAWPRHGQGRLPGGLGAERARIAAGLRDRLAAAARERASLDLVAAGALVASLQALFGEHLWIGVELLHELDDELWLAALQELSQRSGVALWRRATSTCMCARASACRT